jgi:hypothetical protein
MSATRQQFLILADGTYQCRRLSDPDRTEVQTATGGWLATFTDGAYTVTLAGPERTFTEPSAAQPVVTSVWVRVLPAPFDGTVDTGWLDGALADQSPDIFAFAMEYVHGAPPLLDDQGLKVGGEAQYGPLGPDGKRKEGADFNDYLGISWRYGDRTDRPERSQANCLDCSGFMRIVWGYRAGLPLALTPDGVGIPRRAFEILDGAPGVIVVPNGGAQVTDLSRLAPGDLVFFDADPDDGPQIDHVGMYLGADMGGRHRFISSRKTNNGPTLGDSGGASRLDGRGFYARTFRAVRRL